MRKRLSQITHAGADVFDSVRVDAIVTLFVIKSKELSAYKFDKNKKRNLMYKANISKLPEPYLIDYLFTKNNQFVIDMDKMSGRFTDLGVECEGSCATHDPYELDPLIKNLKNYDSNKYFRIINTGTISKYHDRWGEKEMTHFGTKTLCPVVEKKAFTNKFGRTYVARAKSPKVIFKGINLLDAVIDFDASIVPYKSTLVVCSNDADLLKIICALLNSKLVFRYIKVKYASSSYCGGTTFTKGMINYLPLPELSSQTKDKIISLVDSIIATKKADANADTLREEKEIDKIVYKIYGITDQSEIDLIEGRFNV